MRVEFYKRERHGRDTVGWDAFTGKRTRVPGTTMAAQKGLPHDLTQYVVEAASGYENGFWGLLAKGATYKSTGRKRTKPGRAVIAAHRRELAHAEALAGRRVDAWRAGEQSPAAQALHDASALWDQLGPGERLIYQWPSPVGTVQREGSSA